MQFDWDEKKNASNRTKHRIAFQVAITVFDDPLALIAPDPKHSHEEVREWIIGESDNGVLVVVFTIRQPGDIYRLISARRANRKERGKYEESKRVSI